MNIAIFDPFCGISGNMVLGALIDAGADASILRDMLRGMDIGDWEISVRKVTRKGLCGTYVAVEAPHRAESRHLSDIEELLKSADLPSRVAMQSITAFRHLADAEAEAHGIPVEEVHFHETGAVDAILDIAGSFCCLHLLNIDSVFSTPVTTGTGTVECEHGILPVPAPATMHLLKGVPTVPSGIQAELVTPTGAAILRSAVKSWEVPPPFVPSASGMGAGTRDLERPNLLRVTTGSTSGRSKWMTDVCSEIRLVIDDMDMRTWPDAADLILESGAFECYAVMCIGRKGRPAIEATILCPPGSTDAVTECIFRNTSTLGMRIESTSRAVLERKFIDVETGYGVIPVKIGLLDGRPVRVEPEYSNCLCASRVHGVPVANVINEARNVAVGIELEGS